MFIYMVFQAIYFQFSDYFCSAIVQGAYNLPPSSFFVDDRFIPSIVSNGDYKVTANLSQNDEKIACVHLEFSITRS